jgi:hypothetical protein
MDKARQLAEILQRYIIARGFFEPVELLVPPLDDDLDFKLRQGTRLIYGAFVDLSRSPPVIARDDSNPEFLAAICGPETLAGVEATTMDELRKYVYENGPLPMIPDDLRIGNVKNNDPSFIGAV